MLCMGWQKEYELFSLRVFVKHVMGILGNYSQRCVFASMTNREHSELCSNKKTPIDDVTVHKGINVVFVSPFPAFSVKTDPARLATQLLAVRPRFNENSVALSCY